jgi:hypothetical protein
MMFGELRLDRDFLECLIQFGEYLREGSF